MNKPYFLIRRSYHRCIFLAPMESNFQSLYIPEPTELPTRQLFLYSIILFHFHHIISPTLPSTISLLLHKTSFPFPPATSSSCAEASSSFSTQLPTTFLLNLLAWEPVAISLGELDDSVSFDIIEVSQAFEADKTFSKPSRSHFTADEMSKGQSVGTKRPKSGSSQRNPSSQQAFTTCTNSIVITTTRSFIPFEERILAFCTWFPELQTWLKRWTSISGGRVDRHSFARNFECLCNAVFRMLLYNHTVLNGFSLQDI